MIRVGILTISDAVAKGIQQDAAATLLRQGLDSQYHVVAYDIIPQESSQIRRVMRLWSEREMLDVVITLGANSLGIKDHAPEVTAELLDQRMDALSQVIALANYQKLPHSVTTRGVVGIKNKSLLVNMSDQPDIALNTLHTLLPFLPGIAEQLRLKPDLA